MLDLDQAEIASARFLLYAEYLKRTTYTYMPSSDNGAFLQCEKHNQQCIISVPPRYMGEPETRVYYTVRQRCCTINGV